MLHQIFAAVCCMVPVAGSVLLLLLWRHRRTIHNIEEGICVKCGYDLRGQVVPRCPECGLAFDPQEINGPNGQPPARDHD